ncbi:MAG: hypothetical protein EOP00_10920 [Pedobacter sp.]|nr:MAG: hypothetical protein EOP00_10920 [Pedobacter sp.]
MKKITTILLAFITLTTLFLSCKKDEEAPASATATVTVTTSLLGFDGVNGTSFKSTTANVTKVGNSYTLVAVEDGAKRNITIVLNNVTATGTFTLDKGNANQNIATLNKDNTSADATLSYKTDGVSTAGVIGGGSVIISKLSDTEIEAKFFIIAYNSAKKESFVENGAFSGKLTKN